MAGVQCEILIRNGNLNCVAMAVREMTRSFDHEDTLEEAIKRERNGDDGGALERFRAARARATHELHSCQHALHAVLDPIAAQGDDDAP